MDYSAIGIGIIAGIALLILVILIIVSNAQTRITRENAKEQTQALQTMLQALQQEQAQISLLDQRMSHFEPAIQTVSNLQADVRGLSERITTVESNQSKLSQGVGYLATNSLSAFSELKTLTGGLAEATSAMRSELARAKTDLTELHTHARAEQEIDRQIAESVRRLETIIAGTQTKGTAGENLLETVFSKLPVEWQVRDFKLAGKTVEFGLRLPNGLILPIDSKWTATSLIEQFVAADGSQEQVRIKREIEDAVLLKAKEVRKYVDPTITVGFGVAVIPDAIYDLCISIQVEVFQMNVVLVSYSMFVPYLLLVFQTALSASRNIDLQKLEAYLQTAQTAVAEAYNELDGRFSRAITMLGNSRDDLRIHLGQLSSSLTGLQISEKAAVPDSIGAGDNSIIEAE